TSLGSKSDVEAQQADALGCPTRRRARDGGHRAGKPEAHRPRPFRTHGGLAENLPGAGLVPRRQVRHLGALGTAGGAAPWRLVRALDVRAWPSGLCPSPPELRASVRVRL